MGSVEVEDHEVGPLKEFREATSDLKQNDSVHIRFLRARNLNIRKAGDMLRNYLKWRDDFDPTSLKDWKAPDIIREDYLYGFTGFANDNTPVLVVPYGRWEVRRILETGLREESIKYVHRLLDEIMAQIEKSGAKQFHVVLDSAGMTFWKVAHLETIETAVQIFKEFESYYPETLKSCYVINSPWVFPYVYNFVKPLLSTRTLAKVQLFDSNETKWKEALLKTIPASALPANYGGTGPAFRFKGERGVHIT